MNQKDDLRASRALVIYNKTFKANDDSVSSYAQGSQNSDNQIISAALYEEHKDKLFDNNFVIDEDAAELLVQRYVSRFKFTPFIYSWTTQERFLTFKTGDVVDLVTFTNHKDNTQIHKGRQDLRRQSYEL